MVRFKIAHHATVVATLALSQGHRGVWLGDEATATQGLLYYGIPCSGAHGIKSSCIALLSLAVQQA